MRKPNPCNGKAFVYQSHATGHMGGVVVTESDHDYFMRRAAEERAAAERTQHPDVQRSHLELAHRYEAAAAAVIGMPVVQLRPGSPGVVPEGGSSRRKA
jgi:hypothetical protein